MPSDLLLSSGAPGVKTSTFSTSGITFPKAASWNELFMRVVFASASNASGANSITFDVDISYDGASTWLELTGAAPLVLSTTAQSGEIFIPVPITRQDLVNATSTNAPQVRLTGTFSGAGASPTINILGVDLVPSRL